MEQLTELERERLARELVRNKPLPFAEEFRRTTNLERAILDQYGLHGAEFILRHNGLVPAVDGSCPWQIDGLDAAAAVGKVLAPLRRRLPQFVSTLEERIRWVMPARSNGAWVLVYLVDRALYDGRPYYQLILGGAPNAKPRPSERAESLGWTVPASLRLLYGIHNGLGAPDGRILGSQQLVDLGAIMDPIAKEQNFVPDNYEFQDLLEFRPDGAGNCQAFHRHGRDDADPLTVDWDHETREISGEMPFFDYADEILLSQILDEE